MRASVRVAPVSPKFPRGLTDDELAAALDEMSEQSAAAAVDFSQLLPELQRGLINEGALEQARRQSDKLARTAIYISIAAVVVSTAVTSLTALT
jgi:hypothetical protein